MTGRVATCQTFARRVAMYEVEARAYEAAGFRHTGRMTRDARGLEKPIWRHNPEGQKIWSRV